MQELEQQHAEQLQEERRRADEAMQRRKDQIEKE